ncbi:hypothetical protein BDZ45DRAFT_252597 [Acephala macrosclerotiorum]|nr:hypothetical protein BDZ45DRAFT_252597 [Acephala macrosclerotiorum]
MILQHGSIALRSPSCISATLHASLSQSAAFPVSRKLLLSGLPLLPHQIRGDLNTRLSYGKPQFRTTTTGGELNGRIINVHETQPAQLQGGNLNWISCLGAFK